MFIQLFYAVIGAAVLCSCQAQNITRHPDTNLTRSSTIRSVQNFTHPYTTSMQNVTGPPMRYTTVANSTCYPQYLYGNGYIFSPNYPGNYGNDLNCQWYISAYSGQTVVLQFDKFEVEQCGSSCTCDALEIHDGPNSLSPRINTLCGSLTSNFSRIVSSGSSLYLRFRTDGSATRRGFQIYFYSGVLIPTTSSVSNMTTMPPNVTSGCGGPKYLYGSGKFSSRNYPSTYPNNLFCEWYLYADYPMRINLYFSFFEVEQCNGNSCTCDYVEVSGHGNSSTRHCGHIRPPYIISNGGFLHVKFRTDGSRGMKGFLAYFHSEYPPTSLPMTTLPDFNNTSGCGGPKRLIAGGPYYYTNISSRNYPGNYSDNIYCEWIVSAYTYYQTVLLTFRDFQLESCRSCGCDVVEVRDGSSVSSPILSRHCGRPSLPFTVQSTGRYMHIIFRTDGSSRHKGFFAYFQQRPRVFTTAWPYPWTTTYTNVTMSGCGGPKHLNYRGVLRSRNFPYEYPSWWTCEWVLSSTHESLKAVLNFTDFNVSCERSHYVEVRDGSYSGAPVIGSYCGSKLPPPARSSGMYMYIKFTSRSPPGGYFQANFSSRYFNPDWLTTPYPRLTTSRRPTQPSGCGGNRFLYENGSFTSLNYDGLNQTYPDNLDCEWVLRSTDSRKIIELGFVYFDVENCSGCQCDFLEVRDGPYNNSALLAKLCGNATPTPIRSSRNYMFVRFKTDGSVRRRGFHAYFFSHTPQAPAKMLPNGTVAARMGTWMSLNGSDPLLGRLSASQLTSSLYHMLIQYLSFFGSTVDRIQVKVDTKSYRDMGMIFASAEIKLPPEWKKEPRFLDHDRLFQGINNIYTDTLRDRHFTLKTHWGDGRVYVPKMEVAPIRVLPRFLYEVCTFFSYCGAHQPNVECADDGSNTGTKRCLCKPKFVAAYGPTEEGWPQCYAKISSVRDRTCEPCEKNGGTCFSGYPGGSRLGCSCPNTRGGRNCEINYVMVNCTRDHMSVCFKPFDHNYSNHYFRSRNLNQMLTPVGNKKPLASIHFKNRKNSPTCDFKRNNLARHSHAWSCDWRSSLSLKDKHLDICAVNKYKRDGRLYYENTVEVEVPNAFYSVSFKTFCSFQETVNKGRMSELDVKLPVGGETGVFEAARITMTIRDLNNRLLSNGASIYEKDQLFLNFKLHDDKGLFRRIRVEFCTASTRPTLEDMSGHTKALLQDSCPAPGQNYLTKYNSFHPVAADVTQLQNSPAGIPAFRLGQSDSLYIHCTVRVCRDIDECKEKRCRSENDGSANIRVKRSAISSSKRSGTINLSHQFVVRRSDERSQQRRDMKGDQSSDNWMMPAFMISNFLVVAAVLCVAAAGAIFVVRRTKINGRPFSVEHEPLLIDS